ncbi:MAG: transcriptional repressor NrdR [Clostridia bacterium]|nr:transcriptional repressor NrdR [Clostridia bacterium]
MKCPLCSNSDSRVLDSRPIDDGASIKRRRECPSCGKRFTTYEVVDTVPIEVIKRDGRREFFDKHKLARGIKIACQKRAVDAEAIALAIEQELMNEIATAITSVEIGERVLARLKECDIVAYIRFASIYRDFQDIDSFTTELKSLSKKSKKKSATEEKK